MDWRPIKTAPKDGTAILIYAAPDMGVAVWYRGDVEPGEPNEFEPYWAIWDGHDHNSAYRRHLMNPTHWMPLPPQPKT